jgi:hypothetical protein
MLLKCILEGWLRFGPVLLGGAVLTVGIVLPGQQVIWFLNSFMNIVPAVRLLMNGSSVGFARFCI